MTSYGAQSPKLPSVCAAPPELRRDLKASVVDHVCARRSEARTAGGLEVSLGGLSRKTVSNTKTAERTQQLDRANHCVVRLLGVNLNEITHIENKSYFSK